MATKKKKLSLNSLVSKVKTDKKFRLILLMLAAGVVILFLASPSDPKKEPEAAAQNSTIESLDEYTERYVKELEKRLTVAIKSIKGVGETQVIITLESGAKYVYAESSTSRQDSEYGTKVSESSSNDSTYIVIDGADGEQPIVLYRVEPIVQGVVVVSKGGGNINIKQAVVDIITTACGIGSNRVSVSEMS